MKFYELGPENSKVVRSEIYTRWKQLNSLVVNISERANKQLFILNGAGAIALMSFLGIATGGINFFVIKISLCFFILGVILSGVVTAILFHGLSFMLEGWRKDSGGFYSNNIDYETLLANDEKRSQSKGNDKWPIIWSYSSFGCFILGCLITLAGFIFI